jgi:hypothetical protein
MWTWSWLGLWHLFPLSSGRGLQTNSRDFSGGHSSKAPAWESDRNQRIASDMFACIHRAVDTLTSVLTTLRGAQFSGHGAACMGTVAPAVGHDKRITRRKHIYIRGTRM